MSSNLRRPDHGGDPAQGPVPEMANPAPSPRAGEDFPDEPTSGDTGRDQDQPDLDAFAERLGLRGDEPTDERGSSSETPDTQTVGDRAKRAGSSVASTVASGLADLADRMGRLARRLEPGDRS